MMRRATTAFDRLHLLSAQLCESSENPNQKLQMKSTKSAASVMVDTGGLHTDGLPQLEVMDFPKKPTDDVLIERCPDNVAVLLLNKAPVNSFDEAFGDAICEALEELKEDDSVKAVVIASALPKVVSAGVDLSVAYQPDRDRLFGLLRALEAATLAIWTFPKPTVLALAGTVLAGGAFFSLCADYRFAAKGTKVGFTEAAIEMPVPKWALALGDFVVGPKHSNRIMQLGNLMTCEEAYQIGFLDEVVEDYAAVKELALTKAAALGKAWTEASAENKERQHAEIAKLIVPGGESTEELTENFVKPRAQAHLAKFLKK